MPGIHAVIRSNADARLAKAQRGRVSSELFTLERLERIGGGSHARHEAGGELNQSKDTRHGRKIAMSIGEAPNRKAEQLPTAGEDDRNPPWDESRR